MAVNTKQPFVYTMAHKMLGDQPTGNTTISNVGVTKLVAATTYTLQNPSGAGALKTIYRVSGLTTANTSISPQTGGAFDGNGGTQVLVLQGSTTGTVEASVTLISESTAQWRIVNSYPGRAADSTSAGVRVTT